MSTKKRKIGFYAFKVISPDGKTFAVKDPRILIKACNAIMAAAPKDRSVLIPEEHRYYSLHSMANNGKQTFMQLVTAKYHHRPPLVHVHLHTIRQSPKHLSEGEEEPVHIVLKINGDECLLLLEERKVGISVVRLRDLFNEFLRRFARSPNDNFSAAYRLIPKKNFLEEVNKLTRVTLGELYLEKKILGSEFLDYSNRTESLRSDIALVVQPTRGNCVRDVIVDAYQKYLLGARLEKQITRIRVSGENPDGGVISFDTEKMRLIRHIDVDLDDDTGLVDSSSLRSKMSQIMDEIDA